MKTHKLRGNAEMELKLRNMQWDLDAWENWCDKHDMSLIIEDGKVKGYESRPVRWHV